MTWNPEITPAPSVFSLTTETVVWDGDAEVFVRLTIAACGRILARSELDPPERRAALRRLFALRTSLDEQRAIGRLLKDFGLLVVRGSAPTAAAMSQRVELLSRLFVASSDSQAVAAFVEHMEIAMRDFLVLAWCVAAVAVDAGDPLPRLEDLDADLPFMPAYGLERPASQFDADATLAEIDAEEPEGGGGPALRPTFSRQ
ncbi:hypothetical protein [Bosea caraganae]|uniref:hypothetical protein n=1 Tax=Bosea caraganae TaxID=2763117 RepID=UPI0011C07974|nr:hypothetical protein [Bosea caraganae]